MPLLIRLNGQSRAAVVAAVVVLVCGGGGFGLFVCLKALRAATHVGDTWMSPQPTFFCLATFCSVSWSEWVWIKVERACSATHRTAMQCNAMHCNAMNATRSDQMQQTGTHKVPC